jgi:hypothetical protein
MTRILVEPSGSDNGADTFVSHGRFRGRHGPGVVKAASAGSGETEDLSAKTLVYRMVSPPELISACRIFAVAIVNLKTKRPERDNTLRCGCGHCLVSVEPTGTYAM